MKQTGKAARIKKTAILTILILLLAGITACKKETEDPQKARKVEQKEKEADSPPLPSPSEEALESQEDFPSLEPSPEPVAPSKKIYKGYCGEKGKRKNVKWKLNTQRGTLVIWGKGDMKHATGDGDWGSEFPWWGKHESIKKVIIKEGVTHIGGRAFWDCDNLKEVELPDTIREIGSAAFEECDGLEEIRIPSSVKKIDISAFYNCRGLKKVVFKEGIELIGWTAFGNCIALEKVSLPKSIQFVDRMAFVNCTNLREVRVNGKTKLWEGSVFQGCEKLEKVFLCQGVDFPVVTKQMEEITGAMVYAGIMLRAGEQTGTYFFAACYALSEIALPKSIKTIPLRFFSACTKLKEIVLPENVKEIQSEAFCKCKNLKTIIIQSKKLEKVHKKAFRGLPEDVVLYVPKEKEKEYRKLFQKSGVNLDKIEIKSLKD